MRKMWSFLAVVAVIIGSVAPVEASSTVLVADRANISSGHSNQVLESTASGWGGLYGDVIPEDIYTSGSTWYSGGQICWSVTANIAGTFMPHDGTVSPKMGAYNLLGNQRSQTGLSTNSIVFEDKGDWWKAEFFPGLSAQLDLATNVNHDIWTDPDGGVTDYWVGMSDVSVNIEHGLITNSSSNFWRYDYNDRPSEWQAQFNFSGIGTPFTTKVSLLSQAVPEPATMAMLGVGMIFIRRRRVA